MIIKTFPELAEKAKGVEKRLAVAGGNAPSVIKSIAEATEANIVKAVMVGDRDEIQRLSDEAQIDFNIWEIVHEKEPRTVAERTVELVRNGHADLMMKGFISTAEYTKAILDRKKGLMGDSRLLTHITVFSAENYHKLLIVSDAAIIVEPDLAQKVAMLNCCRQIAGALGIERPKAAVISCVEKPSFKVDSTIEARALKRLAENGKIRGVDVDGPLAIDLALSKRCAEEKKFKSSVAGDADILIFPNIESANVFYKTMTIMAGAKLAAAVAGSKVPCILTSRADTEETKFYSIALGALLADDKSNVEQGLGGC